MDGFKLGAAIDLLFTNGGVVMWPLLGLSLLSMTAILERSLFWLLAVRRQQALIRHVFTVYRTNRDRTFVLLKQHEHLPVARIFLAALDLDRPTPEQFRLALETAAQAEIPALKRFNNLFETVIGIAPLLGLLGTVLGLIAALSSLSLGDLASTEAAEVTAGIGQALTSTAAGLVVAIATLLFANLFRGLYVRQIALIQEYGGQLELMYLQKYREENFENAHS